MTLSRRQFVAGTMLAGALGGTASGRAAAGRRRTAPVGDWPTAHYDAANTAYARNEAPARLPLTDVWNDDGDGANTGPAVANGVVYAGTDGGSVVAVDARTGQTRWRYQADSPVRTTPAVGRELVYFGCDDGTVRAISVVDRTEFWRTQTGAAVRASPTVVGDTLYVGTENGVILALDTFDGDERWTYDVGGPISSAPAVADGTVYVGTDNGGVVAVDAASSKGQWSTYLGDRQALTAPAVAGNRVVVGSRDGRVYALSLDGTQTWMDDVDSPISVPPAVVGGDAVVASEDGAVRRIRIDGGRRWTSYANTGPRAPAIASDTIYVPSEVGRLYVIGLASGELRGVQDIGATPTTPAAVDGHLFMGVDGRLTSFRQQDSTPTPTIQPTRTGTRTPGSGRTQTGAAGPGLGGPSGGSDMVVIAAIAATGVGAMVTLMLWLQSKT